MPEPTRSNRREARRSDKMRVGIEIIEGALKADGKEIGHAKWVALEILKNAAEEADA